MKKFLIILVAVITPTITWSQICQAEKEFQDANCGESAGKCAVMTINTDPKGKDYTYRWNCGDGKTETGRSVEHCYDNYGVYYISLDLIDKKTGEIVKREIEKTLAVQALPAITQPARTIANEATEFTYDYDVPPGFSVKGVYWSYGDEQFSCGSKGSHTFTTAGNYTVRVLVSGTLNDEPANFCGTTSVKVFPGNINGPVILDVFVMQEKAGIGGKRFLDDDAFLALLDSNEIKVVVVKRGGSHVPLEPNKEYSVTAYKGNLFMPAVRFRAGEAGKEDESLDMAIRKMTAQRMDSLPGYRFMQDVADVKPEGLQKLVEFGKANPAAKLNIGIYTHTGGKTGRNQNLSTQRAEAIKQYLTNQGVAASRINLFTCKEDMRLLNTCLGLMNCNLEDQAYNKKAEFRIVYSRSSN